MFCIRFTNKDSPIGKTEIVVGEFREELETSLEFWPAAQYEQQWLAAIGEIVSGAKKSALVTSVTPPKTANFLFWWPVYRVRDSVFVQNQVLMLDDVRDGFSLERISEFVPERETVNEDGDKISEWHTSIGELELFLRAAG